MELTLTDEKTHKGTQSLNLTRLGKTERRQGEPVQSRKFRTTIKRDSYDFQSYARVELWTPAGWTEVVTLDGTHPVMADLPSYAVPEGEKREAAFAAMRNVARMLETQAEEVTR